MLPKDEREYKKEKEVLFAEHLKVSKKEDDAKKKRLEIEAEIEAIFPFTDALSKTFKEEKYKITIKKNPVMKLDNKLYIPIRESIPEELRPEKIKYDLDSKGFKWLKENNKDIYKKVSDCISEKDGKTSVKVEKI